MDFLRSLSIAFSMYSAVPMPQFQWDQKNYENSFAFFPLVGAVLSGILFLLSEAFVFIGISTLAASLALTAVIVIYTGGFHIDGYMDTMDALCSHRDREEKIRIMKDSHIGAFGVIELVVLALLMSAGIFEAECRGCLGSVLYGFVVSRTLSGVAVCTFKRRDKNTSLIHFETGGSRQFTLTMMFIYLFAVIALSFLNHDSSVVFAVLVCVAWLFISKLIYEKQFGGISGDTSGHFLCICEALFTWTVVLFFALRSRL
ncbi:MAG: adenosylcobinamide-GDP ribazoletransferase [Candidatus Weimeria sp.]